MKKGFIFLMGLLLVFSTKNVLATECVSDAQWRIVERYYGLNSQKKHRNYGANWYRVMISYSDEREDKIIPSWLGATAKPTAGYTVTEARAGEKMWYGWTPVRKVLECLEEKADEVEVQPEQRQSEQQQVDVPAAMSIELSYPGGFGPTGNVTEDGYMNQKIRIHADFHYSNSPGDFRFCLSKPPPPSVEILGMEMRTVYVNGDARQRYCTDSVNIANGGGNFRNPGQCRYGRNDPCKPFDWAHTDRILNGITSPILTFDSKMRTLDNNIVHGDASIPVLTPELWENNGSLIMTGGTTTPPAPGLVVIDDDVAVIEIYKRNTSSICNQWHRGRCIGYKNEWWLSVSKPINAWYDSPSFAVLGNQQIKLSFKMGNTDVQRHFSYKSSVFERLLPIQGMPNCHAPASMKISGLKPDVINVFSSASSIRRNQVILKLPWGEDLCNP